MSPGDTVMVSHQDYPSTGWGPGTLVRFEGDDVVIVLEGHEVKFEGHEYIVRTVQS